MFIPYYIHNEPTGALPLDPMRGPKFSSGQLKESQHNVNHMESLWLNNVFEQQEPKCTVITCADEQSCKL